VSDVKTPTPLDLARLAREIAMDMLDVPTILRLNEVTDQDWERIQNNPQFVSMLNAMARDFQSVQNTKERVKLKASTGVEAVLETILEDVVDRDIPLGQRIEAMKMLAKLGELGEQKEGGGAGEKVSIQIHIGERAEPVVIDAIPVAQIEDAS
jgi:hypothetical protein